jgi:hypothetical protein
MVLTVVNDEYKKLGGISTHFKREAKIMVGLFLVVVVLGLIAGLLGPWIFQYLPVR